MDDSIFEVLDIWGPCMLEMTCLFMRHVSEYLAILSDVTKEPHVTFTDQFYASFFDNLGLHFKF